MVSEARPLQNPHSNSIFASFPPAEDKDTAPNALVAFPEGGRCRTATTWSLSQSWGLEPGCPLERGGSHANAWQNGRTPEGWRVAAY